LVFYKYIIISMKFSGGILASEGLAYEKVYVYKHETAVVQHDLIDKSKVGSEVNRFDSALSSLIEECKSMTFSSDEEKTFIDMYIAMLADPDIKERIENTISNKYYNAPLAVLSVLDEYIDILKETKDEYISERTSDLEDVKKKLINRLLGIPDSLEITEPAILISDYLLPSEMLALDKSLLKAIVVERGGSTSHIAILSRSLGIPAILAVKDITKYAHAGEYAIVDAIKGDVILNPSDNELHQYKKELASTQRKETELRRNSKLPSITKDGYSVHLMCNIEGLDGIDGVIKSESEGIGLFRTEFLFLQKELFFDEDRKAEIYREVAKAMADIGPVVIRTMDVGGDKFTSELGVQEDNPFLGNRSIRYAMEHKDLFRNQLISILKASVYNNIELMFPFISGPDELEEVLSFFEDVKTECREKAIPFDEKMKVGTMIEVPSAAIVSDIIADMVDFMSIGTNDLIQYTIAVDRGNSKVAKLYSPLHPAVLRLLKSIVESGEKKGKPISICGEMAGTVEYIPILIGLGINKLSMVAQSILKVKERIRQLEYSECKALVDRLLKLKSEEEIEKELKEFNNGKA